MRVRFTVSVTVIAVVAAITLGRAEARLAGGDIAPDAAPAWIAVAAPEVSRDFRRDLPPQVEHVLMLRLDTEADLAIEATVDALLRRADMAVAQTSPGPVSDVTAGGIVALAWGGLFLLGLAVRRNWVRRFG